MKHEYKGNKGDDGVMWHTHRASQFLIQPDVVNEDELMRCEYKGNVGDDGPMQCTHRASRPPILHDDNMFRCNHYEKEGNDRLM